MEVLYASSHLTGTFLNPANAVGNTPGTWAGDLNANSSYTSRWAIANPVDPLTASATQTVRVIARKGSNSGNPSIALNLYENGVLVGSLVGDTAITSTTGQTVQGTFASEAISNPADVEIEVVQTAAGGSPSTRNCAQVATIEWTADTTVAAPDPAEGSGSISGVGALTGSGQAIAEGQGTVTGVGSLVGAGHVSAEGFGTLTGVGSLAGDGDAPSVVGAAGSGSITGVGELEATGQTAHSGFGEITTTGDLTGDGEAPAVAGAGGSGEITAVGEMIGDGAVTLSGFGSITGAGSLDGDGSAPVVGAGGAGAITAVGTLTAVGYVIMQGSGGISTTGDLSASGQANHDGAGFISGAGELVGAAVGTPPTRRRLEAVPAHLRSMEARSMKRPGTEGSEA